ncbi:MAG: right-handed parallel beta-helix repeat-containing protein [Promethearchaeota archaeon]
MNINKRFILFIFLISACFCLFMCFIIPNFEEKRVNPRETNAPNLGLIIIRSSSFLANGNSELALISDYGNGSASNPFVIENKSIDGNFNSTCIRILNTDAYLVIRNCTLSNGSLGIDLFNVTHVTVENNTVIDNVNSGISLAMSFNGNNFIENNTCVNCSIAIYVISSRGNYFKNNVVFNNSHAAFYDNNGNGNIIVNNSFWNNKVGFNVRQATNETLKGNDLRNHENFITLFSSVEINISGNRFNDCEKSGMEIMSSSRLLTIENNSLENVSLNGISFFNSLDNDIVNNTIRLVGNFGILLSNCTNNSIVNNTLVNTTRRAISLALSSSSNLVESNVMNNTNGSAIYLNESSVSNQFLGNKINGGENSIGICLNGSINNTVIAGNNIHSLETGFCIINSGNCSVVNNTLEDINNSAIFLSNVKTSNISYNNMTTCKDGIDLNASSDLGDISKNKVMNFSQHGIYVQSNSARLILKENSIHGNGSGTGMEIESGINVTIIINDISNVSIGIKILGSSSMNSVVINNTIQYTGDGIHVTGTNGPLIVNNTICHSMHCVYVLSSNNVSIITNKFNNCSNGVNIYNCDYALIDGNWINGSSGSSLHFDELHDSIASNNIMNNSKDCGVYAYMAANLTVMGNNISNVGLEGVFLSGGSSFQVFNNTVTATLIGIRVQSISGANITNNTVDSSSTEGIYLFIVDASVISNNHVFKNAMRGILISSGHDNTVVNNTCYNHSSGIMIQNSRDNEIKGNEVGNNTQHGFYILGNCENCLFLNNSVLNNSLHGFHVLSSNITITNNTIFNDASGIYLSSVNVTVEYNEIFNISGFGVNITGLKDSIIKENNIHDCQGGGMSILDSEHLILDHDNVHDCYHHAIFLINTSNSSIVGNFIQNITLGGADGIHLDSNSHQNYMIANIIDQVEGYSLLISSSNFNQVKDNVISNSTYGLYAFCFNNGSISNNTIINCSSSAIHLTTNSTLNNVSGNDIHGNFMGITIRLNSNNNTIVNNTVRDCTQYGIYLYLSNWSFISENDIQTCNQIGIYIYSSFNTSVINNTINDNNRGVSLEISSYNTLTFNTLVNNQLYPCIEEDLASNNNLIANNTCAPRGTVLNAILPKIDQDGDISLAWANLTWASKYYIYRSNLPIHDVSGLNFIASTNETSYTDHLLTNGLFYYAIIATNLIVNSSISNSENVSVQAPPSGVVVDPIIPAIVHDGIVQLNWTQDLRADHYRVYRGEDHIFSYIGLDPVAIVSTNYHEDTIDIDGRYYYVIVAENIYANSSQSNEVNVTVEFYPSTPVLYPISPAIDEDGIIELNWSVSSHAEHYYIYRSESSISSVSGMVPIAIITENYFTDNVTKDGKYYYIVVAGNQNGNSSASSEQSVVVDLPEHQKSLPPGVTAAIIIIIVIAAGVSLFVLDKKGAIHLKQSMKKMARKLDEKIAGSAKRLNLKYQAASRKSRTSSVNVENISSDGDGEGNGKDNGEPSPDSRTSKEKNHEKK